MLFIIHGPSNEQDMFAKCSTKNCLYKNCLIMSNTMFLVLFLCDERIKRVFPPFLFCSDTALSTWWTSVARCQVSAQRCVSPSFCPPCRRKEGTLLPTENRPVSLTPHLNELLFFSKVMLIGWFSPFKRPWPNASWAKTGWQLAERRSEGTNSMKHFKVS